MQLHLRSLVLFGLAYMTPIIVLGIFGVIATLSNGGSAGSYLLATVAMLFTALSYGLMARHFPVAGSAYTYVRKALDSRLGFVVGWAILLDYLFLPLVIWLIGGSYLQGEFPHVPFFVWIVAYILITSALNVIGLKVADRTNFVLMTVQLLILTFFVICRSHTWSAVRIRCCPPPRSSEGAVSGRWPPVRPWRRTHSSASMRSAR